LNGPGYQDLDASLTKAFGLPKMPVLGSAAVFEIRADAYNLFNKININTGQIDDTVGSGAHDTRMGFAKSRVFSCLYYGYISRNMEI
jgi:hypothetical protein